MGKAKRTALKQARRLNLLVWLAFSNSIIGTDKIKKGPFSDGCQVDKFKKLLESIKAFLQLVICLAAIDPTANHSEPKFTTPKAQLWLFEEAVKLLLRESFPNGRNRKHPVGING